MSNTINGDLSIRAVADTRRMAWTPSPSGSVWRKRVHQVGSAESGQVTSLVRYDAQSAFPAHDHPEGEEILVLDGVFSDERGDWPAGTYLLNPEGFRHAPHSALGCLLFVKLRQFPGADRQQLALDTHRLHWQPASLDGVVIKPLYQQPGFPDRMHLERWSAQTDLGRLTHEQGAEILVLDGEFHDDHGTYGSGCWLRLPMGFSHHPRTTAGCALYIKTGGFSCLRSAS